MTTLLRVHLASLLVLASIGPCARSANAQFERGHWQSDFGGYLSTDNRIRSAAYDEEGRLFLAGDFLHVQGIEARAVARWDVGEIDSLPNQWHSASKVAVIDGQAFVFGRQIEYYGPDHIHYPDVLAAWNGSSWRKLSDDLSYGLCLMQVNAIVEHQNEIYIGGKFRLSDSSQNIGRLTDDGWEGLAGGMTGPFFFDCLFADVTAIVGEEGGSLLAGGEFDEVAGMPAKYLVRWDGDAWQTIEHEPPGPVDVMVSDGEGGLFLAGIEESATWPEPTWIGRWSASGVTRFPPLEGRAGAMHRRPNGAILVAVYPYPWYNGLAPAEHLLEWTGTEWIEYGGPLIGDVLQIGETPSGQLFIAGYFTTVGPSPVVNFAVWNGHDWEGVLSDTNQGPDRSVLDTVKDPDGRGVIIAGDFLSVAGQPIRYVARWTGASWEEVGDPLDGPVSSLVLLNDGVLVASGRFTTDGKSQLGGITRLVGAEWQPIEGFGEGPIEAMTSCPDGDLFVVTYDRQILRWNGMSIDTVGHAADNSILTLACGRDNTLYAGGIFEQIHGVAANRIAAWSNGTWQALGTGVDSWVTALATDKQNRVYAGGLFYTAGGQPASRIARWDGAWSEVGGGVNGPVYALTIDSLGRVYVGGAFTTAGTLEVDRLAAWRTAEGWSAPSPGLEGGHVESLSVIGRDLWVGGTFTLAGGQPSNRLAVFTGITTTHTDETEVPGNRVAADIRVFPNPVVAGTEVTIELSSIFQGRVSVDVFDVLGRHVTSLLNDHTSTSSRRLSLDTKALVTGVYFVQVRTVAGQATWTRSFVVR